MSANVVVELYSESHARQPTTRAWAIIRRADRAHRLAGQRASAPSAARPSVPTALTDPSRPRSGRWRPTLANLHLPDRPDSEQRFHPGAVGL